MKMERIQQTDGSALPLLTIVEHCGRESTGTGNIGRQRPKKVLQKQHFKNTFIFNMLFIAGIYPVSWTISKLIMLFKKGLVMNCGNYRGKTIMQVVSKCYDYLIHNRLMKWYVPRREQAGAQSKRGCSEHYIALIIECAR